MTHDPLCTTVLNTEMSEAFCNCDLIARVREDERGNCVRAIRSRRDALLEQVSARRVQTRSLASAIYEDAIATLRLLAKDKPITTYTP